MKMHSAMTAAVCVALIAVAGCGADEPAPTIDNRVSGPWMPDPFDTGIGLEASVEAACRAALEVAEDLPVRHPQDVIGAPLVLVDARGQSIVHALFGTEDGTGGVCWNGEVVPQRGVRRAADYSLLLSFPPDLEPVGDRELCMKIAQGHGRPLSPDAPPPDGWTIGGRAGSAVASVTIEAGDAGMVTPTFRDGWFLAWAPSRDSSYAIVAHSRDGDEVARLDALTLAQGFACSDDVP
jgi:hypothetical protein